MLVVMSWLDILVIWFSWSVVLLLLTLIVVHIWFLSSFQDLWHLLLVLLITKVAHLVTDIAVVRVLSEFGLTRFKI